ncbi:cell division protein FtsQ/DivIB [Streptomyces sp. NPDC050560]|uniref:cell division protein FtsQ/DivIB n=1 Tax=Streptomyces sp. NPDC050560 TaxID=3365630 RepID=UPI0037B22893
MAGPSTAERAERPRPRPGAPRPPRAPRLRLSALTPRARRIIALALALAVVGAGGTSWLLYGSPWLKVRHVNVSGNHALDTGRLRDAAGVANGTALVSVDTAAVAARLRKALPRIDSVRVSRSWPNAIGLKVTERSAVLVIGKGGKFIEVDATGKRFATVGSAPKGLPRLVLGSAGAAPSAARFPEARLLRGAARAVAALPAAARHDTRTVKVRSYDDITVELTRGRTVAWGSGEDGAAKGRALAALMKAAPKAAHFDVSAPTAPATAAS